LIDQTQGKTIIRCGITQVHFANIDDLTIEAYVESQEPLQCAGAFAIEGKGGLFIEKIDGCHTNVIGLSLPLLRTMISELGYQVTDFW
jgi:septum formation protein